MKTAVEFILNLDLGLDEQGKEFRVKDALSVNEIRKAKEMEKEQMAYSKEDVLKAGEMGEINHLDTKHIVSYLDEAKQYNETFKQQEQ